MARQKYKNANGEDLVGTTTVLAQEDGGGLIGAANALGLKGIATKGANGEWDKASAIGTACHERIQAHLSGTPLDRSQTQLAKPFQNDAIWDASLVPYGSFLAWREGKTLAGQAECPMVHPTLRYGGTLDFLEASSGTLWDWKTSKPYLFKEGLAKTVGQISAYWMLCEANGIPIQSATVVRFPKEGGAAEEYTVTPGPILEAGKTMFLGLLQAWYARKIINQKDKK